MDSADRGNNEIDHLIRNAELRTELEPFLDESVLMVDTQQMPTALENEFLASLLAWESAPVLPIAQWFNPPLTLPAVRTLSDQQVRDQLDHVIQQLYSQDIILDFTAHLDDRELYQLIACEILPSKEKKVQFPGNFLRWHCIDEQQDTEIWLRYYANEQDRDLWQEFNPGQPMPPMELPPYPRILPGAE